MSQYGVENNLKKTREALKLSLLDVATSLKVRISVLENIENNRVDLLPSPDYADKLIKSYAEYLNTTAFNVVNLPDHKGEVFKNLHSSLLPGKFLLIFSLISVLVLALFFK